MGIALRVTKRTWAVFGGIIVAALLMVGAFTLTTSAADCTCSIWSDADTPAQLNVIDNQAVELGTKFQSNIDGEVTGIRFYKGSSNTGTHVGSLWTASGTRLAFGTFENETGSGWQTLTFASPVEITANTTYVASYNSPTGAYSASQNYFTVDRENAPLRALASNGNGGNGVYAYGTAGTFPTSTYNNNNYWVDVTFEEGGEADTVAPSVTSVAPAASATNVGHGANITAVFNEALSTSTVNTTTVELRDSSNQIVAANVSYSQTNSTLTINPDANLASEAVYTVTLKGGSTDPRIKDTSGNALAQNYTWSFTTSSTYCGSMNEIACENTRAGNPASQWDIGTSAGDPNIQGFATDMSVNRGNTINFKVKTPSTDYVLDIYRLGYYAGNGARKITTVTPSATLPQTQPDCLTESATGLIDCGNWAESASWAVPSDAVSGVYLAQLKRQDATGSSHIIFVVRNDASTADILYQTSDTTWGAAYNNYGGNSLYTGSPAGRAYKVSYNRPLNTRSTTYMRTNFFANEQPMIRWAESNGYDMSYTSGVDTHRQSSSVIQQHKMFMSSGHDEYWSATQRDNVEDARDAGVHLSFFSGNQVFWKTRWENSIDSSGTPNRTMVAYKETLAGAKIDPSSEWTGTWRDPRFSPPSDGGKPENALSGQIFTINCCAAAAMQIPEEAGKLRLWRNTSVANQQANGTATLTPGTVGFEADEDLDNGFRPAGLFRMSHTPLTGVNKLQDYGGQYANGNATHSITLYKAPSGALVFGAGTVRWSWGLDGTHDDSASSPGSAPDLAMKQATVNLFADMDVQPTTLQAGLVAATKTTDTTAPTSTITNPASQATVQAGDPTTITGTASDAGGRVGGVEVSVDNGATWRRAEGRTNWSYTHTFTGQGEVTIKVRAADDSGNIETPGAGTTVTVNAASSVSLFSSSSVPTVASTSDTDAVEIGLKFYSDVTGSVTGVRFYKGAANTGTHTGSLWNLAGDRLATVTFSGESASGWQQANFETPVAITANTTYVISYYAPNGGFSVNWQQFNAAGVDNAPLHAPSNAVQGGNAVFRYQTGGGFPNQTFNGSNYWVDVVFSPGSSTPDTEAPTTPTNVDAEANSATQVTVTWAASTDNVGVTGYKIYRDGTQIGTSTTTTYVDNTTSANTAYDYTVRAHDAANNNSSLSDEANVITPEGSNESVSLFAPSDIPTLASINEADPVEVGMKFTSSTAGQVSAVRFYKGAANTGTHTGSLWTASGTLLANVTFTSESASGWQQANFETPVAITANTTYVVSYFAPSGGYSFNGNYFASNVTNSYLTAPASSTSGGNGVFKYGSTSSFPNESFNAGNYWIDVVFTPSTSTDTEAPTAPTNAQATANSATQVTVTWTASTDNVGVTGYKIYRDGTQIGTSTSTSYTDTTVGGGTAYVYTVRANDAANNTSGNSNNANVTTPGGSQSISLFSPSSTPNEQNLVENDPIEVGVKFSSSTAGQITGVRFFKGTSNTGTHVGSLWTTSGTLLANVTFTDETASGWQQANFSSPVSIDANTTYVVSYFSPNGAFSRNTAYFTSAHTNSYLTAPANGTNGGNGVFKYVSSSSFPDQSFNASNYWVDVVFAPSGGSSDTEAPTAPTNAQATANSATQVTVTWAASTDNVGVTGYKIYRGGTQVGTSTTTTYVDNTASANSSYVYTVRAHDAASNNSAASNNANVTTPASAGNTSVFSLSDVPTTPSASDTAAVELGMKFRSDKAGKITGVRFYKGANNTGTHVGNLWSSTGTLLSTVTFTNETATGWQQANFSSPVDIAANTTYIVSYFAPSGGYAVNGAYFASTGADNAPLHGLAAGVDGANGVFTYASSSAFPTSSWNSTNYWVDVVYQPNTQTLFAGTSTPTTASYNDSDALELGMKFRSDVAGTVNGVRFYKGATNTGTHTGSLWTSTGTLLATATFTNESATGWQQVNFSTPVSISANTTYVVSYYAPNGNYAVDAAYFTTAVTNGNLEGLSSGSSGGNGLYKYGSSSVFPDNSFNAANYWVDAVFEPAS